MTSAATNDVDPPSSDSGLWADLDAAARSLEEIFERGGELSLDLDERTGRLRILLDDANGALQLTPTQLFELLGGNPL